VEEENQIDMKFFTATQLYDKFNTEKDFYIIDIRDPEDFDIASIQGSVNIPRLQVESMLSTIPKDKLIAIVCRFGTKSAGIARLLEKNGWNENDIYVLDEGIISWATEIDPSMPAHLL
jgi:adenylyltransferase/sulfurtransferase